jgi:putative DNA primase/helicase
MAVAPLSPALDRPVDRVLAKLTGVKSQGASRRAWMARCPAHDDREASLSVTEGRDGRALLKCHAGCDSGAICARIGLSMTDLFADGGRPSQHLAPRRAEPSPAETRAQRLVKSYDYTDADGNLLFQVCRFEPKTFRQRRRAPDGDWVWGLGETAPVLYRLPEVIEAVAMGRPVYVVEGEKDADALAEFGFAATTAPMGAGKWRDSFAEVLAGAQVVVLPDNDDPGRTHAEGVAATCFERECMVKVVALPGVPPKGDLSDWLEQGHDLDELQSLVDAAAVWHPDPETRDCWRLDELLANPEFMKPPTAVVPWLAFEARSTLLAAGEKSGKSTLTGYLAACVSTGRPFLGRPCVPGAVLIVGLEEFIGDCARRLEHFGADPKRVHVMNRVPSDPVARPLAVMRYIARYKPVLVIVDSLIAYGRGSVSDWNASAQAEPVVQQITDLAHEGRAAVILIHHAKKADGRYRDSSAIGGAVDVIAEVFTPDRDTDPTLRRVRVVGRVPSCDFQMRFDGSTYALDSGSDAPLDQRIMEKVRSNPGVSTNTLVDLLAARRSDVTSTVTRLLRDGQLRDTGTQKGHKLTVPGDALDSWFGGSR